MPRTDGEKTKQHILDVAEALFAENGFDGTSVDRIADTAGVNKALIYYYFKDKEEVLTSLLQTITQEVNDYLEHTLAPDAVDNAAKIREEIRFLARRKKILTIMLMEALKTNARQDFMFECIETFLRHKQETDRQFGIAAQSLPDDGDLPHLVYEFFTGLMPVMSFIVFQDKWCERFGCTPAELLDIFIEALEKTHFAPHE